MGDSEERLSDADHDQTVDWLRDHLLSGRLTREEFSEIIDAVRSRRQPTISATAGLTL